jgi:hypothetical protein
MIDISNAMADIEHPVCVIIGRTMSFGGQACRVLKTLKMTNTVRNHVCLDVIANGLVVNQTLFVQTVTCMQFLEHDKLVPPNDIVLPIIT